MGIALKLAEKGIGKVNPNPLVGAVIVKNNRIIGQCYHMKYGENHAEVNAIESLKEDPSGATLYVTLEPCSHYGKTPPCTDRIIESKISKVVIGMLDPNPLVSGNGVKKLKEAGIKVVLGVLEEKCREINEVFIKYITKKRPFVVLKSAMSLDGKIATYTGESKYITGEKSREEVHKLRNKLSSIMVGVNTVIKDNPQLTCRLEGGHSPVRIVVDSTLRIPRKSKVISDKYKQNTIIATTVLAEKEKINYLQSLGVNVLIAKVKNNKVDLNDLMVKLSEIAIDSILLEGGAALNYSALEEGIVDKIKIFIAPKLIGGEESKTPIGGSGIDSLKDAFKVNNLTMKRTGEDILLEGYVEGRSDKCLQE